MTEQYLPTNINAPRGSRLVTEDAFLTLDSDLVVVETSGSSIALLLPDATQIPAREIKFKANTLTDPVVIAALDGQNIDGNPSISMTDDQETVCLKSDGENWREVCSDDGGGGAGGTYQATLALGQDSGVLGRYLNLGSRAVVGSDVASSPIPGVFTDPSESYRYAGSHSSILAAGGGEGLGTYVLDPTDLIQNTNASLFDGGPAVIEWEAYRYASNNGSNPPTLRGYGAAKETWTVGLGTAQLAVLYSDINQFSGFDSFRLAVGSIARSIAFEVLEAPAAGPIPFMFTRFFYRITYANNVTAF